MGPLRFDGFASVTRPNRFSGPEEHRMLGSKMWQRRGIVSGRPLRGARRRPLVGVERLEERVALSSFAPHGDPLPTGPAPGLVAVGTFSEGETSR